MDLMKIIWLHFVQDLDNQRRKVQDKEDEDSTFDWLAVSGWQPKT